VTAAAAHPHSGARTTLTFSTFASLAMWAWFLYGFGSMLPLLRAEQDASRTLMGMHSFALSLGAIVAGLSFVRLVARLQRRGAAWLGMAMVAVGTVVLCLVVSPWVTLPATLVAGIGGSMVINAVTAAVTQHHGPSGGAILSESNAVAALVGLVAPLTVGLTASLGWTWRPALLVVLPLTGLAAWVLHRVPRGWPELDGASTHGASAGGGPAGGGPAGGVQPAGPAPTAGSDDRLPLSFWLLLCSIMATVGIEFCCTAWAADLLRQRTTLSASSSSASVSIFVGGLFVGRSLAGRFARRQRSEPILMGALVVIIGGWAVLWLSHAALPALAGLALLGVGVSVQYPLTAGLAYATATHAGDRVSGALSLFVGTAAGVAPFVIGAVADATSTHTAFVLVPLLALTALGLLLARDYAAQRGAAVRV